MTPFQLAGLFVTASRDKKAWKPVRINVTRHTTVADYFVVCEGETDRQVRAICDNIQAEARKLDIRPLRVEGYEEGSWVVMDFDAVVVHVLLPGEREFYNLEGLWRTERLRGFGGEPA